MIFIARENLAKIKQDGVYGAPDLIIEILSPGAAQYDTNKKKDVYERTGVKEHWIVDPTNKTTIGYSFDDGKFIALESATGVIQSKLLNKSLSF